MEATKAHMITARDLKAAEAVKQLVKALVNLRSPEACGEKGTWKTNLWSNEMKMEPFDHLTRWYLKWLNRSPDLKPAQNIYGDTIIYFFIRWHYFTETCKFSLNKKAKLYWTCLNSRGKTTRSLMNAHCCYKPVVIQNSWPGLHRQHHKFPWWFNQV